MDTLTVATPVNMHRLQCKLGCPEYIKGCMLFQQCNQSSSQLPSYTSAMILVLLVCSTLQAFTGQPITSENGTYTHAQSCLDTLSYSRHYYTSQIQTLQRPKYDDTAQSVRLSVSVHFPASIPLGEPHRKSYLI